MLYDSNAFEIIHFITISSDFKSRGTRYLNNRYAMVMGYLTDYVFLIQSIYLQWMKAIFVQFSDKS